MGKKSMPKYTIRGVVNMLNDLSILIIGGDNRYVEVMKELAQEGATVYIAGYDTLTEDVDALHTNLKDVNFSKLDALLLPVSGTNSEGEVELAPFSKTKLKLTEKMIKQTKKDCTIYTGVSNNFLDAIAERTDRELIPLFTRDDMAILNSIPTAEGTLALAMEETDTMIHGSNVLVLGFGRVGLTAAKLFASVGAQVGVSARKAADLARIKEMGLKPIHVNKIEQEAAKHDILINTIPSLIVDKNVLSSVPTSSLIIDLASAPGGVDFEVAKEKGIKAIHALGLPGKVAPKSAGKIIADVLIELLKEDNTSFN